ncbi:D-alanyl-D-alanine carboxypeptidase DacC [Roseovarius sp. EC-HK134]|mgnify:FL=1|uniref:serine-type D-Ala-D-Ala carboxypeptidase n=1 Tax=Roseovarius mucosus TaxID=215743 RepID=A0A1V0RTA0_9RHOB|nr:MULTISPECIES: D-alanyl-D-alanine carboxypeptidase family protein [Roseovarius]ARE84875.1 D-alanyl-D-alanine carboxypeptidase DacC [Roseovarius mucosus]MBW4975860.1 D-alanyl-D-alanine carboxypeptidase [Roseovarius mucosus]VVT23659.1 D-alanyl-D-alanine carboxypeptidase DacC [Roseovarius sp. EC-SD190]VVT23866.1 D-alanyl-D-alanine carboxypeptidase DacC [Roseovarius sp. EC-HK134]|tara:strand:+ start:5384 stop:6547 length:1164 start_codon:yes stop_codon:yes gene_type:complete
MRLIRHIAAATLCLGVALPAQAFETSAKAAYVMDVTTGTVLLDKNADTPMPPASMSKLMTLYVAFEAVRSGRLTLDERLPVSQHAMSYGGSTMFLDTTDRVRVEDLLRGIIVLSGNDACAVIAEALSPDGTEAGFARFMTQRAQQMGMTNSIFRNASGWPAEGHVMSMRDLALLARHIIEDFPEFYPMFAETEFRFDGRAPSNISNRNPLLGLGIGADGLKTGHTEQAGFGLTGSAKQGERRVVFVISGLATAQDRARESESIVNWAFRQFAEKSVLTAGEEVARAAVWMGEATSVGLTVAEDVSTLLPVLDGGELKGEVVYTGPVRAPVAKGDVLAELVFAPEGLPSTRVPLVAAEDVAQGGFMTRIRTVSGVLLARLQQGPEGAL